MRGGCGLACGTFWSSKETAITKLKGMLSHSKEAVLAARDKAKHSALNIAAWHGNVEGVKLLIAAGADANNADVNGHRPLHHALHAQQPKPEIVQALLDAGASPGAMAKDSETALGRAKSKGLTEIVSILRQVAAA